MSYKLIRLGKGTKREMPQLIGLGKMGIVSRKAGGGFPGGVASDFLDGVIPSTVFDLDATISDSYGGSGQIWANLTTSPNDGETQTAYDFFRGADVNVASDDPTFTGSAGSNAAYWLLDGGDHFSLASGTNTDFLSGLHKTSGAGSGPWTVGAAFRVIGTPGSQGLFGTTNGSTNGVEMFIVDSTTIRINVTRGSTFVINNFTVPALSTGDDILFIITGDPTVTDDLKLYWNSTTPITDSDMNTDTSSTDASTLMKLAALRNGIFELFADTRIYGYFAFNEFISDAQAALVFAHLELRHNRDYTP